MLLNTVCREKDLISYYACGLPTDIQLANVGNKTLHFTGLSFDPIITLHIMEMLIKVPWGQGIHFLIMLLGEAALSSLASSPNVPQL